ncbi:hypothetical protein A7P61_17115 [Pantoea agglomerans pv. betae]|jgi:hypothetical protein|uniref:hypothetical protein n=1 Tax=Enterobacter agglomerans TaxID=549 RepID=UPI0007E59EC5|nr:hypothetical protein [Pantoea agglomerans]WHU82993.1 hypothetical protein A7P61_17115 [Pantoea agglomerans pv. betae]
MIDTPDATLIGGTNMLGILIPGAIVIGGQSKTPPATIFIQNDSNKSPTSPWFVTQVDSTHYNMPNATAPKGWQYLGAFIVSGETGAQIGRADGAIWTVSDPSIIQHITTSAAGQAAMSIITGGICTLTVTLRGMVSTLVITAV